MKKSVCLLMVMLSLAACNERDTTVTVKTDSVGRALDTLGAKIEEKVNVAGDSVKAAYNNLKERVKAGQDSIRNRHNDKAD